MVAVVGSFDRLAAAAVLRLALAVHCGLCYFVPRLARVREGPGRCPLADDRADHRRLHQHRDRQALLSCPARGRLCARRDAGFHGQRAQPDAAGERVRGRQPHAEHAADREHGGSHAVAVDQRSGRSRRDGRGDRDGAAAERHLALGDVGVRGAVRAHRHGAGRHQHVEPPACRQRPAGCATAAGDAWRDPLRARELRLRRQGQSHRRARRCISARARRSAWSAAPAPANRRS